MTDYRTALASIEAKLQQLGAQLPGQSAHDQSQIIAQQQKTINEQNQIINQLREENKSLNPGNQPPTAGSTADIQHRINQLIRTIDHTLTLIGPPAAGGATAP